MRVEIERVEPVPGRVSTVFRVPGHDPAAPALTLLGHTDVVPSDPRTWSRDPFSGEVRDWIVWGRGAIDMLNVTSAMAVVTRAVARSPKRLAGDLVFAAVADEEAGSRYGVGRIAEHRPCCSRSTPRRRDRMQRPQHCTGSPAPTRMGRLPGGPGSSR
ncbi:M20/M25/M40 family metallo-hydrolase [Streptomyces sp. NPDC001536]|uniref:M20/M25/M40 family metallo-hydrolase n=1 Tax=Streptomyces sp. NPDC001536 TaxID=3364583 RepID=UPI0036AA8D37